MSLELGEILCSRGLELGSFDPDTKLMLLRAAVKAGCWSLARVLLRELPTTMDIDALDSDGRTLLSLATMSPPGGAGFVMQLIEAGADIHRTVSLTITAGTGYADGENTTPLKQALMRPTVFPIKQMLRKQPIAGNSQAMGHRYLHWAVTMPWRLGVPYTRRSVPSEARGSAIRLLLAAGADPSQVDDNGDTALSVFLRELECSDPELIREIFHWVRPLARGVDVNRKNKQGFTAADYLLMLLETEDDDLADFLDCQFRFRPLGNGRPRDVEILWGVKEY
jgi:ankyrin repeat protein